ncbi:hypothetical protein H072_8319 [Dactylellina haptotyla CBS 200.50]|uniref:Uncharacterized protein n=1 Tax=Dactylellina haptotyla (strain CBS 200.50) TaxID=1284197 RepID=S8BFB1_DACHA|nr:hypothetical protein H072_8319 [Dactylellina haptotyla CBS 200.50]
MSVKNRPVENPDSDGFQLTTVRETLMENDQNTPENYGTYDARSQWQTTDSKVQPQSRGSVNQIKIPKINFQTNQYQNDGPISFRGYGNLNPMDTARGASRKIEPIKTYGDQDDYPAIPTETDEYNSHDNLTPNIDISLARENSFSMVQKPRTISHIAKKSPNKSTALKYFTSNPHDNSVTWFKPGTDDTSTLSKLEPVWQGKFIQPPWAKGFLISVLNSLTDDLWVVAKKGFPYEGYNLFTQKFVEAEAARWNKVNRRMYLSETDLVLYTCTNTVKPFPFSLISEKEALFMEGKTCPDVGGKFISWGWELRKSESAFVDPRIEGTLYWEGVSPSGSLQSIFPPEDDNRLWWSVRRSNGERRRVPLIGLLSAPVFPKPSIGGLSIDTQKLARKMPHLARYKPIETENSHILNRFEEGIWFKRPFQISGAFVQSAKTSTLVPWHLYIEEGPSQPVGTKTRRDSFLIAKQDGRDTATVKPTTWIAKRVKLTGSTIVQNRIYRYPLDKYGYGKFIYACNGEGRYLRVGTQKEATLECTEADYIYANFEFFVSYLNYKTNHEAHHEGIEIVFAPDDSPKSTQAMAIGEATTGRPTLAKLLVINGESVVDSKMILHAEIFA